MKLRPEIGSISFAIGLPLSGILIAQGLPTQSERVERSASLEFCNPQQQKKIFARTELLFGLSKPDQVVIAELEFQRFIDQEVTPLFPDGLTLFDVAGQFRNHTGAVVKERSKLLLILYPFRAERDRKIEQIRQAYVKRFQQESVLRIDDRACVSI